MNPHTWAGGRRVPLHQVDAVAVDLDAVPELSEDERSDLAARGRALRDGLVLLASAEAGDLPGRGCAGVHPVYEYADGSRVVVLPEVRVEDEDPARLDVVRRGLTGARVVEEGAERLVLVPESGRGEDALALANRIAEQKVVQVAQPRLIRLLARPEP